jgi:hypothetical protein
MLWNPQCPAVHNRVTGSVTGGASVISMLNNKIITIETRMLPGAFPRSSPGDKKSVLTFIDSILRAFPGTFKLGEGDPRHIGTHRDASVSANHVHIAKNGGDEWTDVEMEAMAEMAAKTGAVTAVEAV